MLARSEAASTPLSFASSPLRGVVLAGFAALSLGVTACTNGAGATCEIDGDCAANLSCCTGGLMRGSCQTDCAGITAPVDAALATTSDSGTTDDAAAAPDAAPSIDAAAAPDAVVVPDAAFAPDAAADTNVDGGS